MVNRLGICILFLVFCTMVHAQTVKPVTLTDKIPYTEPLTLKNVPDVNITTLLVFSEEENTVTLTLRSERKLFVFWEDIKYTRAFSTKRLRTDRLSYSLTGNTADRFRRINYFYRALPKPHNQYLFHQWLTTDDVQTVVTERRIVNDSLVQTFSFPVTSTGFSFRLRDVLFIDETKQKGVIRFYDITFGDDLNTEYRITLQRNPCFGKDEQIEAAQNALEAISRSYTTFRSIYEKGIVNSTEGEQMFLELQAALQTQFPLCQDSSACPAIQQAREQYNQLTDSISALSVTVKTPAGEDNIDHELNARTIYSNARIIDNNVARWLITTDKLEKSDLVEQCNGIIADTADLITKNGTRTQMERDAVAIFRKAEQYFKRTCR